MHLFLIVALGLAILTVIFALQNPIPVGVTFFIWKFEGSLALVLILTFALGVLGDFVDIDPRYRKKKIVNFTSDEENRGAGDSIPRKDPTATLPMTLTLRQ